MCILLGGSRLEIRAPRTRTRKKWIWPLLILNPSLGDGKNQFIRLAHGDKCSEFLLNGDCCFLNIIHRFMFHSASPFWTDSCTILVKVHSMKNPHPSRWWAEMNTLPHLQIICWSWLYMIWGSKGAAWKSPITLYISCFGQVLMLNQLLNVI